MSRLVVGLGNPGVRYEKTRHNLGFMVVEALAEKHHFSFKRSLRVYGKIAQGEIGGKKVSLVMPSTYMNASGQSVSRAKAYYQVALQDLLIVVDDTEIPYGSTRIRAKGSSGGHNGLKSVERELGTDEYNRLRLGVGKSQDVELKQYVLDAFDTQELKMLPEFVEKGVLITEAWIVDGFDQAMRKAADLAKPKK